MMDSCSADAFLSASMLPAMPCSMSVTISRIAGGKSVKREIGSYGLRLPSFKTEFFEFFIRLLSCDLVQFVGDEFLIGEPAIEFGETQPGSRRVMPSPVRAFDAQNELRGIGGTGLVAYRPVGAVPRPGLGRSGRGDQPLALGELKSDYLRNAKIRRALAG